VNIEEYISSGVLESYVLGELSESEIKEVEQMAANHPEIKEEIRLIEDSFEKLAFKTALEPNAGVKEKLMAAIEEEETPVIAMKPDSNAGWMRYAASVSILVAVSASILAYTYYNNWKNTEAQLTSLIAQNQQIASDYNVVNQRLDKIENDFNVVSSSAFSKVTMKGTDNAPDALADIYWNASTEEVYLSIQNLRDLSQEQQFQLWAIIDGQPVDAGTFNLTDGLLKMKNIAGAAAFAVTIEPKGGSVNPSLETMQVVGNV
jgi:anti-sigma-K factor RskA